MTAKEQGLPAVAYGVRRKDATELRHVFVRRNSATDAMEPDDVIHALCTIEAALASDTGERGVVEDLVAQWRRRGRQVVSTWPDDLRAYRYIEQCADELAAALRAQPAGGGWFCPTCDESVPSHHVTFNETHDERAGGCGKDVVGSGESLTQPQPVIEGAGTEGPDYWRGYLAGRAVPPESGGQGEAVAWLEPHHLGALRKRRQNKEAGYILVEVCDSETEDYCCPSTPTPRRMPSGR